MQRISYLDTDDEHLKIADSKKNYRSASLDTDIDQRSVGDDATDVRRGSEVSANSAISAYGDNKRNPSTLGFQTTNARPTVESNDAPRLSTVAELDPNRIQHRMFAQFLKEDAEVKMDNNSPVQYERVETAGFNDSVSNNDNQLINNTLHSHLNESKEQFI